MTATRQSLFGSCALLAMMLCAVAAAAPSCVKRSASAPALRRLQQVMATGRFISYQPTSLQVINGTLNQADEASIRRDLEALRPRFDGLITYRADHGAEHIADIAARLGFRALIIGVWDAADKNELAQALRAAQRQPQLVVGLSLGNESVFNRKLSFEQLTRDIQNVRRTAPQLALTTTETFAYLLKPEAAPVFTVSDFMLVNVHPVFETWFRNAPDRNAVEFVTSVVDKLAAVACGPILVKETGVPTAPAAAGFTPGRQASFDQALEKGFASSGARAFAYFSAFDAPWRASDVTPVPGAHPEEAHWGLYDERRAAKPVVQSIPTLPAK